MSVLRLKPAVPPPDGRQSQTALDVALGARRLLASHGFASVTELTLASGRRADVVGLGPDGTIWIVEIKSSVADFRADGKWPDYRDFCDRFSFAVPEDFPTGILPAETGLVLAASPHGGAAQGRHASFRPRGSGPAAHADRPARGGGMDGLASRDDSL
jgi:hypothetical protein